MPSSISHASMLPKFPDKQRRPGLIHLPQPITTPPRATSKLPALNPSQKQPQTPAKQLDVVRKPNPQLRTPSPSPPSSRRQPHVNARRYKQKRSSVTNILTNILEPSVDAEIIKAPQSPDPSAVAVVVPRPGLIMLSPPPTPAARASNKSSKKNAKNKAQNHVRNVSKPPVLPVSPPMTPEVPQVRFHLDY
jgi:hypothetical protein